MFITFEGPDGSGKTSALNKIIEYLKEKKVDFLFTREPGGTGIPEAEKIRNILLDKDSVIDDMTEAMLYASSRRLNLERNIWPALKGGKIVISDRYFDSSFAYQGHARGLGIDKIIQLNDVATDKTYPDLTIYFDISLEDATTRVGDRAAEDRLEAAGIEFTKKVHEGYRIVIEKFKDRFEIIDASKSKEEVFNQVKDILDRKLGL